MPTSLYHIREPCRTIHWLDFIGRVCKVFKYWQILLINPCQIVRAPSRSHPVVSWIRMQWNSTAFINFAMQSRAHNQALGEVGHSELDLWVT